MANAVKIESLTDELVELIIGFDKIKNAAKFTACREAASREMKNSRFPRTNQFSVRSSFDGLVERFEVLNKDQLARDLQSRLERLEQHKYQWKPEVLSLLLQLSDKPVENTHLDDAHVPEPPEEPPPLTWGDIIAEEPLTDKELWEDVDFRTSHSDYDDEDAAYFSEDVTELTDDSEPSWDAAQSGITAESLVVAPDNDVLGHLSLIQEQVQIWTCERSDIVKVSEAPCIREILHMLLGQLTGLFVVSSNNAIAPRLDYSLESVSDESFKEVLTSFAVIGTDLAVMRQYSELEHEMPMLQTLSARIVDVVSDLERVITGIEKSLVLRADTTYASVLDIEDKLAQYQPILRYFTVVISKVGKLPAEEVYTILDDFHAGINLAQTSGNEPDFQMISKVFLNCLLTYLKPMIKWMTEGQLEPNNPFCPFLENKRADKARFWNDRFAIAKTKTHFDAPRFLWHVLPRIFAAGKDIALLRELNAGHSLPEDSSAEKQLRSSLEALCRGSELEDSYLPLSEVLQARLESLVSHSSKPSWNALRDIVLHNQGLLDVIEALNQLYLHGNSPAFQAFAAGIFSRLEAGKSDWHDVYRIEDILHHTLGATVPENLMAVMVPQRKVESHEMNRGLKSLEVVVFSCEYSWVIQNIIPTSSLSVYQRTFTFLLQIHRAKTLLSQQRLISKPGDSLNTAKGVPPVSTRVDSLQYLVRHWFLWFITTLETYVFYTAISSTSQEFHTLLQEAESMDTLISTNAAFVADLEKRCLLTKEMKNVHNAIISLLDLAVNFADLLSQRTTNGKASAANEDVLRDSSIVTDDSEINQEGEHSQRTQYAPVNSLHIHDDVKLLERMLQIQSQYSRLFGFMVAGLQTAGRSTGAEPAWEVLAAMLRWSDGVSG